MKKFTTVAAGLLLTTSAFASTVTLHRDANIFTADYATKAEALNAGYDIAEAFAAMDQKQLRKELPLLTDNSIRNIVVEQTEIKSEEFAYARGEIQYRAIVNIDYHFDDTDHD